MKVSLIFTTLFLASSFMFPSFAYSQDSDWETHYSRAEKAYASNNLFEARREFMVALKGAKDCKQHEVLASKVEDLASSYQAKENNLLAQPLFKLARKLKTKPGTT